MIQKSQMLLRMLINESLTILLLILMTRVMMPIAKDAKSTAFAPLMMLVEAALLQGTGGGAL